LLREADEPRRHPPEDIVRKAEQQHGFEANACWEFINRSVRLQIAFTPVKSLDLDGASAGWRVTGTRTQLDCKFRLYFKPLVGYHPLMQNFVNALTTTMAMAMCPCARGRGGCGDLAH
jgi:hypothetical protein